MLHSLCQHLLLLLLLLLQLLIQVIRLIRLLELLLGSNRWHLVLLLLLHMSWMT